MRKRFAPVWLGIVSLVIVLPLLSGCSEPTRPDVLVDPDPDQVLSRELTVSSDGSAVVGLTWGGVAVWDSATGGYEVFDEGFLAISPDFSSVVRREDGGVLSLEGLESGEVIRTFKAPADEPDTFEGVLTPNTSSVVFSVDGALLAQANAGGMLLIWNVATGELLKSFELNDPVYDLAFDPKGARVALAQNSSISQLDIDSGEIVGEVEAGIASSVDWSPDGEWLAGEDPDNAPTIWSADDFSVVKSFGGFSANGIALSANQGIAFTVHGESDVFVWVEGSGPEAVRLPGHNNNPSAVAWAPDGSALFSVEAIAEVRRWDSFTAGAVATQFEVPPAG